MSYYDPYDSGNRESVDGVFRQYYANEPAHDLLETHFQNNKDALFSYYNQAQVKHRDDMGPGFLPHGDYSAPLVDDPGFPEEQISQHMNHGLYANNQPLEPAPQQQQWTGYQEPRLRFAQNPYILLGQALQNADFIFGGAGPQRMQQENQHQSQHHQSQHMQSQDQQSQNINHNHLPQEPSAPSRTVYLGNLPNDIEPNELLDYVRSGILESVKILPQKNCAFISFVDLQSALLFHSDCILKKLNIKGHDVRVGWGKNSPMLPQVKEAIQKDGATRNVYLGNLYNLATGEIITEEELRADLSNYGVIDCIKIIPDKGIAFIHFLSILSAMYCVANLPQEKKYLDKKCFYGKDRCAFITKTQQHNAAQYLGLAPGMEHVVTAADREFISSALVQQSAAAAKIATQAGGANNLGNRTVYLGNLHQDSSVEEICNVVRGGLLQSIRYLKERHVCFITFIDPIAAAQFFAMCQLHGLTIHNRRIKVGWGKHSGPLSNALSLAVSNGASRNIYIGNINDFVYFNAQKLRDDFSKFGEIEQINYLEAKNCAFINFVNIANAIKAIDGIKSLNDYKTLKINFGKDRCGNLPRQFQNLSQHLAADSLDTSRLFASTNPVHFNNDTSLSPGHEYRADLG